MRLTVAQALVRFLSVQYSERDGVAAAADPRLLRDLRARQRRRRRAGAAGSRPEAMPFYHARNEQGDGARRGRLRADENRLQTLACTSSIGPGATNMVTGAALATINRLPVLLLPGDVFATRAPGTVLQELEDPTRARRLGQRHAASRSRATATGSSGRSSSRPRCCAAMRVLTDPAETGAVTLALPQDVQAEAFDWPEELFEPRVWRVRRPLPEPDVLAEAAALLRGRAHAADRRGGGTIYAEATDALRRVRRGDGHPGRRDAGRQGLAAVRPPAVASGAIGATGTTAANAIAREADVVLGVGTRWSDFTTASRSHLRQRRRALHQPQRRADRRGQARGRCRCVADARVGLEALREALDGGELRDAARFELGRGGRARLHARSHARCRPRARCIGVVNRVSAARATSSSARRARMPGDLHKLWRTRDPKGYHVEYGYSTMGYEIAGGLGVKMAAPDREVFVMVGDGSYLMMAQEIVTAVAEGIKLTVVLVQNHGYASIGSLSESRRLPALRHEVPLPWNGRDRCRSIWPRTPPASAPTRSYASTIEEFESALREAVASERDDRRADPDRPAHPSAVTPRRGGTCRSPRWPRSTSTRAAREAYERDKATQKTYLKTPETVRTP